MTGTSIPFITREACRGRKDQLKRGMCHNGTEKKTQELRIQQSPKEVSRKSVHF